MQLEGLVAVGDDQKPPWIIVIAMVPCDGEPLYDQRIEGDVEQPGGHADMLHLCEELERGNAVKSPLEASKFEEAAF